MIIVRDLKWQTSISLLSFEAPDRIPIEIVEVTAILKSTMI